jgi:hypothetical protein
VTIKPRWKLVGTSTDGWYQFSNLHHSPDVRREIYAIHRDAFWQVDSRCWDCGMPNGRHGCGCDQVLACWEKQLLRGELADYLCARPTGHEGDCRPPAADPSPAEQKGIDRFGIFAEEES